MFIPWGLGVCIYIYIYTYIETLPARLSELSSTLGFQQILGLTTTQVVEDALEATMVGREDSEGVLRYWALISPKTKGEHLGKKHVEIWEESNVHNVQWKKREQHWRKIWEKLVKHQIHFPKLGKHMEQKDQIQSETHWISWEKSDGNRMIGSA